MGSHYLIKPRPQPNKYDMIQGMSTPMVMREEVDSRGVKYAESEGPFKGDRWPNTVVVKRVLFDSRKKQWKLLKDNGEPADDEWLGLLVQKAKLPYPKGHRKEGEMIVSADMYDFLDPFFQHKDLKLRLEEGVGTIENDMGLNEILVSGLRADSEFAKGNEKVFKNNVKFLLLDPKTEQAAASKFLNKKKKAYMLFGGMDLQKKKDIIRILKNKDFVNNPTEDTMDEEILWFIENDKKLDEFIEAAEMDNVKMQVLEAIQRGMRNNIIVNSRGMYKFKGRDVAATKDGMLEYFFNPKNFEDLEALRIKIGDI